MEIRKVTLGDLRQLQDICRTTFFETFASKNTEDNMRRYSDENFSDEKLTAELTNPDSEFYFATVGGSVVGYLKLNFRQAQTELRDDRAAEIERIYVLRAFHGKHVGQELCDKALGIAKEAKSNYVWLGVWEANPRAIRFYKKNGFAEFDTHMFTLGSDEQTDIMMKLEL
ncbi:MAG TPA: GNAT family N-acetyltransferase [Bacteroidota bacterium]|nr:GNAT family N-acetyltransferase [Bacteroidota bacterium]